MRQRLRTAARGINSCHARTSKRSAPSSPGATPLAITAERESDIREAIALAKDLRIRIVILGGSEAWTLAPTLAAAHIPVVLDPEVDLPQTFDKLGARLDKRRHPGQERRDHRLQRLGEWDLSQLRRRLGAAGRARVARWAMVYPYQSALTAITQGPADIWGVGDHYGRLAPGYDADVVIWDGDPLEPSSAPMAVFVRGERASLTTRQTRLRDRYAPSHAEDALPPAYR